MFDIGFTELMVVAIVALIVIGPERLPKVARTMGHLVGRLQRYVNDVKADINREIELDELKNFKKQFEEAAHSVESGVRAEINNTETEMNSIAADPEKSGSAAPPAPAADTQPGMPDAPAASGDNAAPDPSPADPHARETLVPPGLPPDSAPGDTAPMPRPRGSNA